MKKMNHQLQQIGLTVFLLLNLKGNIQAQQFEFKEENRIYTSTDVTFKGLQGRVAYDFYTSEGNCFGFSIAQVGGIRTEYPDNTMYYNLEDIRLNLSVRYTRYTYDYNRLRLFSIFQVGLSYNTILTGKQLILPTFRAGVGADIKIYKGSGIRVETGIGAPYFASVAYFFTI
jgi:hypothetical protein